MAYRRTYRRRRLTRRPRRMMRRRVYRRRPRLSSLKVHHFKRTFALSQITGAVTDTLGAYTFRLDQLPNYTEFTNLYDCYRINKIVVKFVPDRNSAQLGTTGDYLTQFHTVLDFNDATAPASINALYEYGNWRMTRGSQIHTRVFTPSTMSVVADVAPGTVSGAPKYKQWINTSEADVYHYGLKYCLAAQATALDINVTPYVSFYLSCKSVK